MLMQEKQVHQLMQVKYYLMVAESQRRLGQRASNFAAINLLHEAFESTLIVIADHLNAAIPDRASVDQYFNKIDEKLESSSLPFRVKMMQFNRARVLAKHALTLPDDHSFNSFFGTVPEFCAEAVRRAFDAELDDVNLVDLIVDEETKAFISQAINCRDNKEYFEGLANIRKAFFIMFEKRFDVSVFKDIDDSKPRGLFSPGFGCQAPAYAKTNRYVQDVRDPFSYVVLDHGVLDAELLKDGIDTRLFWNIWRLTPQVWRRSSGDWIIKRDVDMLHGDNLESDLQYSIDGMIQIVLGKQASRSLERYKSRGGLWAVRVRPGASLFTKASKNSALNDTVPADIDHLYVMEAVQGLDSDDWFWSAHHLKKGGPFIGGYLSFDDVEGEIFFGPNPLADPVAGLDEKAGFD